MHTLDDCKIFSRHFLRYYLLTSGSSPGQKSKLWGGWSLLKFTIALTDIIWKQYNCYICKELVLGITHRVCTSTTKQLSVRSFKFTCFNFKYSKLFLKNDWTHKTLVKIYILSLVLHCYCHVIVLYKGQVNTKRQEFEYVSHFLHLKILTPDVVLNVLTCCLLAPC